MTIRTPFLVLPLLLIAGTAAAQSFPGPVVGGHHRQPTQAEIGARAGALRTPVQGQPAVSEADRLYDEIMRASLLPARK